MSKTKSSEKRHPKNSQKDGKECVSATDSGYVHKNTATIVTDSQLPIDDKIQSSSLLLLRELLQSAQIDQLYDRMCTTLCFP